MLNCWGFAIGDREEDIFWVKKSDVMGIRILELSMCFDEQYR